MGFMDGFQMIKLVIYKYRKKLLAWSIGMFLGASFHGWSVWMESGWQYF